MDSSSPPSSPKASPIHSPPIPTPSIPTPSKPIPVGIPIHVLSTTPGSTTSTPLTSSPISGESLTDFDFSQPHDSIGDTSDDSPDSRCIPFDGDSEPYNESPEASYQKEPLANSSSCRPRGLQLAEETHLKLSDHDDTINEGLSDEIIDAVVLDFPQTAVVTSELEGEAIVPLGTLHGVAVPLDLTVTRHEMSPVGKDPMTHSQLSSSLPSGVEGETLPEDYSSASDTGNFNTISIDEGESFSSACVNFARESVGRESFRESESGKESSTELRDLGVSYSFGHLPVNEQRALRPPLRRGIQLLNEGLSYPLSSTVVVSSSGGSSEQEDIRKIGSVPVSQDTSPSVKAKRFRKRGSALSLSLNLEHNISDQQGVHPVLKSHYPSDERPKQQRPSFVALNLDEGAKEGHQGDSWDHKELEAEVLETMKIEKDKWKGSRALKLRSLRLSRESNHDMIEGTMLTQFNEKSKTDSSKKCVKILDGESDSNISNSGNSKRSLCLVKEESQEVTDEEDKRYETNMLPKDNGHENRGYLDDEHDSVSQEDNGIEQNSHMPSKMSQRKSNPDISLSKGQEIIRSHSYNTELNKVMNNLNAASIEQPKRDPVIPAPMLRKRSTSRGRPENQDGKDNNGDESPQSAPKKEISFGPTFAYGDEGGKTSSIFQKFVSTNPIMKLTRSESAKSHSVTKPGREEMFTRSVSNIWEGGVRTKGNGSSSHHGRPPQAPSSLPRDDHRHSHKSAILQQHLYRNSRRNMQQRLLRQLSDLHFEDHRYNSNESFYTSRHDHSHKKHDGHHTRHSNHHHDHHSSSPTDHRWHHHRSQSQKHIHRPKHETLRRLNTYGHEDYHKYVQSHEQRYEQAQEHSEDNYSQGNGEGHGDGDALKLPDREDAVRRISHYRQEEKGKTDVERWVGVHGDQPAEGSQAQQPLLPSPGTPHIVVSPEDSHKHFPHQSPNTDIEAQNINTQGSNGTIFPNAQSTPAPPPTPANNVDDRRSRPDKLALSMTTLDLPDGRDNVVGFTKKTRRNSVSEMHRRFGSQTNLQHSNSVNNIQRSNSRNSLAPSVLDWKQEGNDALIACLSALYGKLLVVMGMAFPVAEVISHDIPVTFYYGFYLYLYIGSIIFLVYAYLFLLRSITLPTETLKSKFQSLRNVMTIPGLSKVLPHRNSSKQEGKDPRGNGIGDIDKESDRASINTGSFKNPKYTLTESNNHGSMYLKMGAVLFGIGSMIYSGLEVGQYFELKTDENCADILLAISPAARMLFTFIQMYFIFLNSRVAISRHRVIARFGLMHMIGTNLCIWLNVLVQETKHEIINLTLGPGGHHGGEYAASNHHATGTGHHGDSTAILGHPAHEADHSAENHTLHEMLNDTAHNNTHDIHQVDDAHHVVKRASSHQALSIYECRRSDLMGELVDEASPFLFPCTIEYSLLCAGVLYVIWKNINKPEVAYDGDSDISTYIARKARHHYSVDCAHANRGLFMGILVLVLTIISLILFFVLINNEAYKEVAILEANIIELSVYGVASITVIIGMVQMRELEFIPEGDIELDNILLLIAQSGVYIYTSFTVIGGHFTMTDNLILPLLSAIITLLQTTLQTIFILDASRRCCYNHDQLQRKPGREMVTFLLVCNLAMWAINTFETSRADAHPTQLNFYGIWAWTIISHISMPLAIFYRFHVTVCLCEIWKRSYKLRHDY